MTIGATAWSNAALGVGVAEQMVGITTQGLRGAWERFKAYHATCAELNALTDRQLDDLGLGRKSIRSVARRAVYGA